MESLIILLLVSMGVVYGLSAIQLTIKVRRFQFVGNTTIYIVLSYLLCLGFALYANYNPMPIAGEAVVINPLVAFASSFFDALKMLAVAFDRTPINRFFDAGPMNFAFGIGYVLCSILALIFSSVSVILFVSKSFGAKILNVLRRLNPNNEAYYIFSDCKAPNAIKLGESLQKQNKIVIMIVSRASLKTQEGTEYRDAIINAKLDVRSENFTAGFCRVLFRLFGKRRRVSVYAMLSSDELAISLANNFKEAILRNRRFKAIAAPNHEMTEKEVAAVKQYKIFITYHDADIDLSHHYSETTLHILNTLSEYDIISTEFIQHNQITNFLDIKDMKSEDNQGLNVTFLGFGKVNRPIFGKMTCAYQLWGDDIHKVHYHILDRDASSFVANASNQYTHKVEKKDPHGFYTPYLYSVDGTGDGQDLTQFEALDRYFDEVLKEGKDSHRFDPNGFEVFVVAIGSTNTNIDVTISLRKSLLKHFDKQRLSKTVLFVRIGSRLVAQHFKKDNLADGKPIVIDQEEFDRGYMKRADRICVPIVIFGEHALMSDYIINHHQVIDKLGIASQKAYYGSDYFQSEVHWLHTKKAEVVANLATIYSLKTKMAVLGYYIDDTYRICDENQNPVDPYLYLKDVREQCDNCGFPNAYAQDNPIIRVANIEHNRWVASSYQIYKYGLLPVEEFFAKNMEPSNEGGEPVLTRKRGWTNMDGVKHVCMLDNDSLMRLRKEIIRKNPSLGKAANDLAFYTDLNMMLDICDALASLQKEN